jgi:uncharacterized protein (DUF305 family)
MSGLRVLSALAAAACATAPAYPAAPPPPAPTYTAADVAFMAGMIAHHAQAVLIAGWAPAHGASPDLRALCARVVVGQRDEIAAMQRWLAERHEPVPDADPRGHTMPGMDHAVLMPGMLSEEQLARLDSAQGADFDRLFLTDMIQHHRGALTMVRALIDTPRAARDGLLFQVASDISADQTAEIDRMTRMLDALSHTPQRSPQ